LILGGSSATGTYVTQIAKQKGLRVVTTTSARNADLARRVGADEVIDYRSQSWPDILSQPGKKVDGVIDCIGEKGAYKLSRRVLVSPRHCPFVTFAEGTTEPLGMIGMGAFAMRMGFRRLWGKPPYRWMWLDEDKLIDGRKPLEKLCELASSGAVRPVIDSVLNFSEAREAFSLVRSGHAAGKVVVRVE
jgi:NADPH:quinone reductase-like Zn-dependent oxidoreductase